MEQLNFFWFLLMQTTFFGAGFVFLAAAGAPLFVPFRREKVIALSLMAIWLVPLVLGGLFVEADRGAKTAGWLGVVALASLGAFLFVSVLVVRRLDDTRVRATLFALANAPFALLGAFVLGMASEGTWL